MTAEARPIAAEIARRLDGLPLAIELAAARVSVLGLAELHSIVERRLPLVAGHSSSDPLRTAVQGLVEWSYDVLHADEKTLLHQVAVHRGGASLPSLLAVGATRGLDERSVTYLLGALVDKSILSVSFPRKRHATTCSTRCASTRSIGSRRVAASLVPGGRTREYFAALAERRGPACAARIGWRGSSGSSSTATTSGRRSRTLARARPGVAIRLGGSLGWYFSLAERVSEGRDFLEAALASAPDDTPLTGASNCSPGSASLRRRSSTWTRESRRANEASRSPRAGRRRRKLHWCG